jgi:hypothetical protein
MIRYRYGRSIWEIGQQWDIVRMSMWDVDSRFGIRHVDMVIYHLDMVILSIDMRHGLMTWEMTLSIWSSPISI